MAQTAVGKICHEECHVDELEEHPKKCMARLMYRCSICDGDYVSKDGLWNHLNLHEIADDSKEFHYQKINASYELKQCTLCNDHRAYQENLFLKHVHEEHDGLFLLCSECGECFRTHELETDHLTYCKAREHIATSGPEPVQEFSSIVPIQVDNTASLAADFNDVNDSDSDKTVQDFEELLVASSISRSESKANAEKILQANQTENTSNLTCLQHLKHVNYQSSSEEIPQPHVKTSSSGLSGTVCPYCDIDCCQEAFLAHHIARSHQPIVCTICGITVSSKNKLSYHKGKYHGEPTYTCPYCSQKFHWKSIFVRHVSTHVMESTFPCKLCGRKFKDEFGVKGHIKRMHSSKKNKSDRTGCDELDQEPLPCDMELNMEIKVEETTLQEQEY